jgi:2,3-bisphosphoglycerate-independent phosphoglycerate mutase
MTVGPFPLVGLVVLDGFGIGPDGPDNAVRRADLPAWRGLAAAYPYTELAASGLAVGLPAGEMGNSEVGHLTMGAGYAVPQTRVRIGQALADGTFARLAGVADLIAAGRAGQLHLMGLLGPGGVHADAEHVFGILELLRSEGAKDLTVHLFLDGRDTPPRSAKRFLADLGPHLPPSLGRVGTVAGRYYAMDRDRRWERTELAYRAITAGEGRAAPDADAAVDQAYAAGEDDEFVRPTVVGAARPFRADAVGLIWNFRADRARQLTAALSEPQFDAFARPDGPRRLTTLVPYDARQAAPALFGPVEVSSPVGRVVSDAGRRQLRAAETEKYAHVTYFFNGGREAPFPGERRRLVPSPKVATYDLAPAMAADAITDAVMAELTGAERPDLFVVNYANADMVGHTGVLEAAIAAVSALDRPLARLAEAVRGAAGALVITADHGNAERMRDPTTGAPHTAHTAAAVPCVVVADRLRGATLRRGAGLASVGVTLLDLMGIAPAPEMDAPSLIDRGD